MKNTLIRQAVFNARPAQRRAAFVLATAAILLLAASNMAVLLVNAGRLRPVATNRLESDYLKARDQEAAAVRQAKAAGRTVDTDTAVVQARADLSLLDVQAGDFGSATRRAKRLVKAAPKNARAQYAYGAALVAGNHMAEGLASYQKAAQLVDEGDSDLKRDILSGYAAALIKAKKPDAGYKMLKQAAAVSPASVDLYLQAARLATGQQKYQDAAAAYLSALCYDPQNTAAQAGLKQLERTHPVAVRAARGQEDSND